MLEPANVGLDPKSFRESLKPSYLKNEMKMALGKVTCGRFSGLSLKLRA